MDSADVVAMGDAGLVGCIALIICLCIDAEDRAEATELSVIADSKDQITVSGRHNLIGRDIGMGISEACGSLA